jgi:large-conductance mechanosensitive channel
LNAIDGVKLWNYSTEGYVESSPAVVNGVVYVGSEDGDVYALGSPPSSYATLFIVIGVVAVFVIVAAAVFLMFRKRLKSKPKRAPSKTQNSPAVQNSNFA